MLPIVALPHGAAAAAPAQMSDASNTVNLFGIRMITPFLHKHAFLHSVCQQHTLCIFVIRPYLTACRELGVDILIDDNPVYAVECAEAGINVLLYDWQLTYPWSKTLDG